MDEIEHFETLQKRTYFKVNMEKFEKFRNINLTLVFITNFIILFHPFVTNPELQGSGGSESGDKLINALGTALIVLTSLILASWAILEAPLNLSEANRVLSTQVDNDPIIDLHSDKASNLLIIQSRLLKAKDRAIYFVKETHLSFYCLNLAFAVLGTIYYDIFFSLMLLEVIDKFPMLKNIVKAVAIPWKKLAMTAFLGIILLYIYGVFAWFLMVPQFDPINNEEYTWICSSMWHCFVTVVNYGLRSPGGIGDILQILSFTHSGYAKITIYEILFFVTVSTLLLNVVLGIIVDTFNALRRQKELKGKLRMLF